MLPSDATMTLNADGFCSRCHKWALDFPHLLCPHCNHASAAAGRDALGLDPEASPIETLLAIKEEMRRTRERQHQILALRSVAARALLRRGNVVADVKAARSKVYAVERWAVADQPRVIQDKLEARRVVRHREMRLDYDEKMRRREDIFVLTADDDIPERLRPSLGERA